MIKRFFFEYVSIISQDHWQLYHSATVLMGLCTLLMLLVVKGLRNLTTLTTISLICLAIANTGDFQWKGSMNKFQTIFLFDISLTFYHICFIFLEIFFFFPFLDTNEIFLITCLLLYFTVYHENIAIFIHPWRSHGGHSDYCDLAGRLHV